MTSPGYVGHFIYSDDQGTRYLVRLARRFGDNPMLGFEPSDRNADAHHPGIRRWPATGLEMRHINVVNRETGLRRRLPVGKLSAPVLNGAPPQTLDLFEPHEGKPLTFTVSSYIGEKKQRLA